MRAKKILALALTAGLVVGSLGVADAKKKKKPKPKPKTKTVFVVTPANYYLSHTPESTCGQEGSVFLSTTSTVGTSSCGHLFMGAIREALITAGQEGLLDAVGLSPKPITYPATDGVPFIIDATKAITGEIIVKSRSAGANGQSVSHGVGPSKLVAVITGTPQGEESVTLGQTTVDYTAQPNSNAKVSFTIDLDDALDKKAFESLELTLSNRGQSVMHGFYSTAGDSFLTVPTFIKKKVKVRG